MSNRQAMLSEQRDLVEKYRTLIVNDLRDAKYLYAMDFLEALLEKVDLYTEVEEEPETEYRPEIYGGEDLTPRKRGSYGEERE